MYPRELFAPCLHRQYLLTDSRVDALLIGAALAIASRNYPSLSRTASRWSVVLFLGIVILVLLADLGSSAETDASPGWLVGPGMIVVCHQRDTRDRLDQLDGRSHEPDPQLEARRRHWPPLIRHLPVSLPSAGVGFPAPWRMALCLLSDARHHRAELTIHRAAGPATSAEVVAASGPRCASCGQLI